MRTTVDLDEELHAEAVARARSERRSLSVAAIETLTTNARHQFWPDVAPYDARTLVGLVGHRQVTEAYLAAAARERGARLATFDRGLAALRPAVVDLIA